MGFDMATQPANRFQVNVGIHMLFVPIILVTSFQMVNALLEQRASRTNYFAGNLPSPTLQSA